MHNLSNVWPPLRMTQQELQYNAPYAGFDSLDDPRPGVLHRVYALRLVQTTVAGETSVTSTPFQGSGRRLRVFAMTFSGDVEWWFFQVQAVSGELFIPLTPLTSLLNLTNTQSNRAVSNFADSITTLLRPNSGPLVFEPNIVLQGSQTLTLSGGVGGSKVGANERSVLNVAVHVWEFGNWGPSGTLPAVAPGQQGAPSAGDASIGGQGLYGAGPVSPAAIQTANRTLQQQLINRAKVRPTTIQPRKK